MNTGDVGVNLDGVHGRIHRGQFFIASEFNTVAGSSTFYYLISTHNKSAHFAFDLTTDGDIQIVVRKQVTASVPGNVVPAINANDFSQFTAETVITESATLTDTGALWECMLITGGPGQSSSSQLIDSRVEEFILSLNDFYAIGVTNLGSNTIDICSRMGWYEPEA